MEGLGIAANVIAVVDLSAQVARLCYQYSIAVAGAREEIGRLSSHVKKLHFVVEDANKLLEEDRVSSGNPSDGPSSSLPTLAKVAKTLGECKNELYALQSKLEPAATGSRMRRIGSRALQWPFKKKDVNAMVQNFERYQRVITDALQMDQTRLLQRNTRLMEQMTLQFAEKAPTKPPSPDLPAACFTIPFPRDPDFVDRSTLMQRLEDQYKGSRQRIALVGMGGFGKSQIAIEFAYRVRETISDAATSVFWVHGSTRARIEQSYRSLADLLEIPRRHEPGVSILTLVRDWLTGPKPGKWLMILDNADDVDVFFATDTAPSTSSASSHETHEPLAAYLPKTGDGKILVTTRSMNAAERLTGGHHSVIQIPTMGQAECLQLVHNNATFVYERTAAEELVQILELIPLAVTQAVAYINRRTPRQSIQSYIQNFRKNEARQGSLLNHDSGDLRRLESASNSIVVTWQITFEQIRRERPSSAELLSLMSFFHSQNIPEEVLQGYVGLSSRTRHDSSQREWSLPDDQSPGEPEANSDDGQLEDDLDALMGYSLIVPTTTLGFYDMHALVQFCTQKWLAEFGKPERWRKLFIRLAAINFPNGEFGTWERCQALLPHFQKLVDREAPDSESSIDRARLMHHMACYMLEIGKPFRALGLIETALSLRRRMLDKEHDETLYSLRVLGLLYVSTGQPVKAEETCTYLLETAKRRHGEQSVMALATADTLAFAYRHQGRIDEAEKLEVYAVEMARHVFGESGTLTLCMERHLATIYCHQKRYDLAEALLDRNLNIMSSIHGDEHRGTLIDMQGLEIIYIRQGRYRAASELQNMYLRATSRVYGQSHPRTIAAKVNLAYLMLMQGLEVETDELYAQTVSLMNEDQGEPSSFPLTCFDLACICYERGRSKDAAKWMQASVEFGLKANGEGHVDTQEAISTLAQWRREDDEMLSHGKLYGATVPDDIGGDSEAPSSISSIGDTA